MGQDKVILDGELSLDLQQDGEGSATINIGHAPVIEALQITDNGVYEAPVGVDGYNPVTVNVPPWSDELYPVCFDVTNYIGRTNDVVNFLHGKYNNTTGDITITDDTEDNGVSETYIPVCAEYTYAKSSDGRLYFLGYYDEDKNYIGSKIYNNLSYKVLDKFPSECKYIRIATHAVTNNWRIRIFRIE